MDPNLTKFSTNPGIVEYLKKNVTPVRAIQALIDNAYDADATIVNINLPEIEDIDIPISVIDNGIGMTNLQIERNYLQIANLRKEEIKSTSLLYRKIKGKDGKGKFAGFKIADMIEVITTPRKDVENSTRFILDQKEIQHEVGEISNASVKLFTAINPTNESGTTIRLIRQISNRATYPNLSLVKEMIVKEYGREVDFSIVLNNELVTFRSLELKEYTRDILIDHIGIIQLSIVVFDKGLRKDSGIQFRVNGKLTTGVYDFLHQNDEIPHSLRKCLYGEIIIEKNVGLYKVGSNSIDEEGSVFVAIKKQVSAALIDILNESRRVEMSLVKARHQKLVNHHISQLPEFKRTFFEQAFERIIEKFYKEDKKKIDVIIRIVASAFDQNDYWYLLHHIDQADPNDIRKLAENLVEFGLADLAMIAHQSSARLRLIEKLHDLVSRSDTREDTIHHIFESNLWLFGPEYDGISSNKRLKSIAEKIFKTEYEGTNPNNRPDIFLGESLASKYLLIEFKKPSISLNRKHESQAKEYRDELKKMLPNQIIDIILIGGSVDQGIVSDESTIKFMSYLQILSTCEKRLRWILEPKD